MKQLIITLFVLFSFTISYAQQKPTKEETLQYIKNELNELNIVSIEMDLGNGRKLKDTSKEVYKLSKMELKSCVLEYQIQHHSSLHTVGYDNGYVNIPRNSEEIIHGNIDFSRTEAITISLEKIRNQDTDGKILSEEYIVFFSFKQKKVNDTYENTGPICVGTVNSDYQDYESLKIYKAFQHLRKLCNAPEPISFD